MELGKIAWSEVVWMFRSRYMPCEECGASVDRTGLPGHECSPERRADYQMFGLRDEVAQLETGSTRLPRDLVGALRVLARRPAGAQLALRQDLGPAARRRPVVVPGVRAQTRGMATDLRQQWFEGLSELRYTASPKRVRALLAGRPVLDTRDALLVYEPRRVVPFYAVPPGDLHLDLTEHDPFPLPELETPVLPPHHHHWHTTPGRSLRLDGHGEVAFRPDDPDLGGRIVLHWGPFSWLEEEEPAIGHPHDPFSRIDVLRSDRHVLVEVSGATIAESSRPRMLVETGLPVRWYLPRQDVRWDLLAPSETHTVCAYKGVASYLDTDGARDVAWFYPDPLHDALPVRDLVCFWRPATVYVDGESVDTSMPGEP